MVKAELKNIQLFVEFLSVANKFVQQGQLIISKDKTSLFCKNPQDFSTSKLMLDTNSLILSNKAEFDTIKYCIKDINALKSSLNIVSQVENINSCVLDLEDVPSIDNSIYAKTLRYKGTAKFKLISIDLISLGNSFQSTKGVAITLSFTSFISSGKSSKPTIFK